MSEWDTAQLGDLCDSARGITYGIVKVGEYIPGGIPVIRGGDIRDNRIVFDDARRVSPEVSEQFRRTILQGGEIVLNLIAEPGHSAVVPSTMAGFNVSRDVAVIPLSSKVNHIFVNCFLKSPAAISWLGSRLNGSVTQKINLGVLREIPVPLPPRSQQDAIAGILGAINDKITVSDGIAATTEQLGRAIFNAYFADSSRFSTSDRELPTGWDCCTFGEVSSVLETGRRPKGGVAGYDNGVPSIGAESITRLAVFDFTKVKYVPEEYFFGMKQGIVEDYDILLYKDGGRPGNFEPHVSMFGRGFPFNRMCINEHVFRIRLAYPLSQAYGYFWLTSEPIMAEMRSRGTGVAIPGLNSRAVRELPMVIPPAEQLAQFDGAVVPLIDRALSAAAEARSLARLRETLLPKLMSGEIRVRDAEQVVEEVT